MKLYSRRSNHGSMTEPPRPGFVAANRIRTALVCLLAGILPVAALGKEPHPSIPVGAIFEARDSWTDRDDESDDARECLAGLQWVAEEFEVHCEAASSWGGDLMIRFNSAIDSGDARNDRVAMEWYQPRERGRPAPAFVVVHESGSRMDVGRLMARCLRKQGFHAFLIHLPFYGERRTGRERPRSANLINAMQQAIADVRRARDAVAVLPMVDSDRINLQGTSLGGFVSATVAGLDQAYHGVFLMLAGGDLFGVLKHGARDTAKIRETLRKAGVTDEQLKHLARTIEPTRLAHRLDPDRTWLYSGRLDSVVPLHNARVLARSARLEPSHHVLMTANHYSGIIYLPFIIEHIASNAR